MSRYAGPRSQGLTHHWNNRSKVLAGGELRHNTPILAVDTNLRGYNAGEYLLAVGDDRCRSFVTRRLDSKNSRRHMPSRLPRSRMVEYGSGCPGDAVLPPILLLFIEEARFSGHKSNGLEPSNSRRKDHTWNPP
jgi:hypothetical protein